MLESKHPTLTTLKDSKLSSTRHEHSVKDQNKLWKSREMTKNEAKFGSGRGGERKEHSRTPNNSKRA